MPIDNPDVVAFVNTQIRVIADYMIGMKMALDIQAPFYTNEIAPLIAGDAAGDLIADGSETDGRIQLTKANLHAIASAMAAVSTAIDAGFTELNKASSNPRVPGL